MKSLIVYSSQTENTKKLAQEIYESLDGEKEIFHVDKAPLPDGYDLTFAGFWLMAGKPDPKSQEYLGKAGKDNRLFLFATHGAATGSDHVKKAVDHAIGLTHHAQIAGVFTCQGEVNPKVLEKVKQKPEPPVWIKDADTAAGHPDEGDLKKLRDLIQQL